MKYVEIWITFQQNSFSSSHVRLSDCHLLDDEKYNLI